MMKTNSARRPARVHRDGLHQGLHHRPADHAAHDRRRSPIVFPRLLNPRNFKTRGEVAVIDPSGRAIADIRTGVLAGARGGTARGAGAADPESGACRRAAVRGRRDSNQMTSAMAAVGCPELRLIERPPHGRRPAGESVAARAGRAASPGADRRPRQRRRAATEERLRQLRDLRPQQRRRSRDGRNSAGPAGRRSSTRAPASRASIDRRSKHSSV